MATEITIPFNYIPRKYQNALYACTDRGYSRAVAVWHRRSGKDKTLINLVAKEMFKKVGTYYYFLPTYAQGKKVIWEAMDKTTGFRMIDHIPKILRKRVNESEMLIETLNGSIFRVIGTDNIDSVVGTNPIGCVFSEYSLQDPKAWEYIRPILRENGGWAIFNFTPRGENHAYDLYQRALANPSKWYCQLLTADDTYREDGSPVLSKAAIDAERQDGMSEELIQQEFYCSFSSAIQGAFYSRVVDEAEKSGRIGNMAYEPRLLVHTFWDLGLKDPTTIWFAQQVGREIRIIDYYENNELSLTDIIKIVKEKPYIYGNHYAPHDIEVREYSTGRSRHEIAASLGIKFKPVPRLSVEDGIEAVRVMFPRFWIDKERCKRGIQALKNYRAEYDEKRKAYKSDPYHDWASHGADSIRYLAISLRDTVLVDRNKFSKTIVPINALTQF